MELFKLDVFPILDHFAINCRCVHNLLLKNNPEHFTFYIEFSKSNMLKFKTFFSENAKSIDPFIQIASLENDVLSLKRQYLQNPFYWFVSNKFLKRLLPQEEGKV